MGILDTILGGLLGGSNAGSSPLGSIMGSILGGNAGGGGSGIGGLIQQFEQAGHGQAANSWVGNGPNQSIEPSALQSVFGQQKINQWSQQTGMDQGSLLSQLATMIPHAVNHMTPNGQVPTGASPFDEAGVELPQR